MANYTITKYGEAEVIVPATQSIAISNYGGGTAKIYYWVVPSNFPADYQFQQNLSNGAVILGPFTNETKVKIESGNSTVVYEVGASPSIGIGDADTLNGLASDTADTADTIVARDSNGDIVANALESTVAAGTAPLTVASTTAVTNLNADTVDGIQGSSIARLDTNNLFDGITLTVGSALRDTPLAVTNTVTKAVVDVSIGAVGAFSFLRPGTNGSISGMNVYDQDSYAAGVSFFGQPNTTGGNQIDYLTIDRDGNVFIPIGNFTAGKKFVLQGAPIAQTTDDTLNAAELDQRIITVNQGASGTSSQTLPTASDMDTYFDGVSNNYGFEFSVINISTDAAEDATIITNTGWTLVGEMTIESNDADRARSSGRFFARKTGTAAWTLYRIA